MNLPPRLRHACFAWCALLAFLPAWAPAQPAARPVPAGTAAHRDLAYIADGDERHRLDLFVPEKGDGPFPLVIWIHGGSWTSGSKNNSPAIGAGLLERGYAVASLNYRLSGQAIFPAQIEDCKAAIRWLRAHAKEYKLDAGHFGVWGSSAGGHLVALVGTSGGAKEFDVGENLEFSSSVQAVCDYFGPTDFVQMNAHNGTVGRLDHDSASSPESRLIGGLIQDQANSGKVQRANPIAYVTKGDPPFLIVHGDADPLVPHHQSELLFEALKNAGVSARFTTVNGGGHGRGFPDAELHPLVREFFDRHLKGEKDAAKWADGMTSVVKAVETPGAPAPGQTRQQGQNRPQGQSGQRGAAGPDRPQNQGRPQGPGGGQGRPSFDNVLAREDLDHDGKISAKEFQGQGQFFSRLDRNGDGFLTRVEFEPRGQGNNRPDAQPAAAPTPPPPPEWRAGTVTSADATPIAYLLVEPNTGNGPFPVLLYLHGAPGDIGEPGLRRLADSARWARFVKEGFVVCIADYRGYPQNQPFSILSGEASAADDVVAIVGQLTKEPKADARRIVILGGSLGGAVALHAVSSGKVTPQGLVLNAPASHVFVGARSSPPGPDAVIADADLDRAGALKRAEKIACPVLLVQGTADPLAPLNRKLDEYLKAAGKDSHLEIFADQGHGFTNGPDNEHYRRALDLTVAFAKKQTAAK